LLVVGEKEQSNGSVTVRRYGEEEQHTVGFDSFLEELRVEIAERKMRLKPGV
jgi:threonyl-tRNA synthetase